MLSLLAVDGHTVFCPLFIEQEDGGMLRAMVESLKEENERIKAENGVYHEERRSMRKRTKEMEVFSPHSLCVAVGNRFTLNL